MDDRADLATLPVVVFGDEGGLSVVARNLRELRQLLGYDCEISVFDDEAYFLRDGYDNDEHSESHREYVGWLAEHFGLAATEEPDSIMQAAQAQFGERFTPVGRALRRRMRPRRRICG